jgi:hypothetical protein
MRRRKAIPNMITLEDYPDRGIPDAADEANIEYRDYPGYPQFVRWRANDDDGTPVGEVKSLAMHRRRPVTSCDVRGRELRTKRYKNHKQAEDVMRSAKKRRKLSGLVKYRYVQEGRNVALDP